MASSPTAWRRWLANEMRALREASGLDQAEVARRIRCTVTKVSYIESGERSFKMSDLTEVLLPLYGVPEEERPRYVDACKKSKERGWWQYYDDEVLPEWVTRYVGLEQGAMSLRSFELQYVHGLFQTERYAAALMHTDAGLTEDEIEGRLEVRHKRQSVLSRREVDPDTGETVDRPLEIHFVADEAILRRNVGGPEVMRGQIEYLGELAARTNVTFQVLPFSAGPHPDISGSFTILDFPWPGDPGVVYIEVPSNALYLEKPHEVADYQQVFDRLCGLALPPDESITLLERMQGDNR